MASTQTTQPAEALTQARTAVDDHRWEAAVELFAVADEAGLLTPDDLDLLGNAEWWTGSMTRAIAAEERAYAGHTAAGDTQRAARTALSLVTEYSHRLEGSVASGWLRRAERLLEGAPESREHGLLERARRNAAYGRGDLEAALEHSSRVSEIGNRLGDSDLIGLGMQDQGRLLIELGRVDEGMALLEEAMVAAVGNELSPRAAAIVYCNATIICEDVADYRRAADFAEAAKRWCDRQHIAGFPGMCRVRRAEIIRLSGDWEKAESEARLACDELRDFSIAYAGEGFYQIGEIRLRLGDFAAAAKAFAEAHELGRDPQPGLAMLHLAQGRTDAAAQPAERVTRQPDRHPSRASAPAPGTGRSFSRSRGRRPGARRGGRDEPAGRNVRHPRPACRGSRRHRPGEPGRGRRRCRGRVLPPVVADLAGAQCPV